MAEATWYLVVGIEFQIPRTRHVGKFDPKRSSRRSAFSLEKQTRKGAPTRVLSQTDFVLYII